MAAPTRRDRRRDTIGSLGDMEYLASSGLWVPVSGPKGTGKVPTTQGDGTLAWAAGSNPLINRWDVNKPPASANALDVEFASDPTISSWPAGWTAQTTDFQNPLFPSTEPGQFSWWYGVAGHTGRYATCPAAGTDFTLAVRVAVQAVPVNYSLAGIGLGSATNSGTGTWAGIYCGQHSGVNTNAPGILVESPSGTIASNWGLQAAVATGVVMYIRRVGTNYTAGWSINGQRGPESGAFTMAASPSFMQVFGYSDRGAVAAHEIFWVRHVSGAGKGARQSWGGLL